MPSADEFGPGELSHLFGSLVAFLDEHRYSGELAGGAEDEWVWMTCTCGEVTSRTLEPPPIVQVC
jgi:hypothetical protein